jgi:L-serine kinase (ADP)
MNEEIEFALLPVESLKAHERVDPSKVEKLVEEIRTTGISEEPIWVARGSGVILNGHHRFAALKQLGARRIPAWVVDYESDLVSLGRWSPGPPISKAEVVRRARAGDLFPVQTTRHSFAARLPAHPTPLDELLGNNGRGGPTHARRSPSPRTPSRG